MGFSILLSSIKMRLYNSLLIAILVARDAHGTADDWGLWPMVTPILGDISDECKAASTEYIRLLNESFNSPERSEEHKNALRRFDSSAPLPFLLDGILLDVSYVDLCDILDNDKKKCPLPDEFRYLGIPYSNGAAPGLEHVCKNLESSKYCHNYIYTYGSEEWSEASRLPIYNADDQLPQIWNKMPSFSWHSMFCLENLLSLVSCSVPFTQLNVLESRYVLFLYSKPPPILKYESFLHLT